MNRLAKLAPLAILLPIVAAAYYLMRPDPECQRHAWYGPMGDGDPLTCVGDAGVDGDAVARGDGGR